MLESVSVAVDEGVQVVEEDDGDGLQVEEDEGDGIQVEEDDGLYVEEAVVAEKRSIKRRIKVMKLITYYKLG